MVTLGSSEAGESWEFAPWVRVHPVQVRQTPNANRGPSKLSRFWETLRGLEASRLPDATAAWIDPASTLAQSLHRERSFNLVVSHGLPVSAHVIGRSVARHANLAWVADWSAPWADNPALERSPLVQAVDRKLEAGLVRDADGVIAANRALFERFRAMRHEIFADGVTRLESGFDPNDFPASSEVRFKRERTRLVCVDVQRNPAHLLEALGLRPDLTAQLEIVFVGLAEAFQHECETLAIEYGVSEAVQFHGAVSREEALAMQRSADVLLSFGHGNAFQANELLADFAASGQPVLHVLAQESDASLERLHQLSRYRVTDNHRLAIAEALEAVLNQDWQGSDQPLALADWRWSHVALHLSRFLEGRVTAYKTVTGVEPAMSRRTA